MKFVQNNQGDGIWANSKRFLPKDQSFVHNIVNILTFCTKTIIYCAASKKFLTRIFLLSNLCMTCIFSKDLVVFGGGICPGGGSHFSPTKNNYEGPSKQNAYPTVMINDVLNRTGALYAHFEYSMKMEPVTELVCCT